MKTALLLSALCIGLSVQAQHVSEFVNFDNYMSSTDNDFENRFDNGTGLIQIQTNGITGGCLQTPQTISWGNDNAIYCTRFKGDDDIIYATQISFKYDTSQLNNINGDRAVSLWMKPYIDPNHYIIASVLDTRRIQIVSYSATSTSNVMQLIHGHWYHLLLVATFDGGVSGDKIPIYSEVTDLGIDGTDSAQQVSSTNVDLYDSIMFADTSIEVSITGTSWGGAQYLDDFHFMGMKSYDNCISTAVEEFASDNIQAFVSRSVLSVLTGNIQEGVIEIYDTRGKRLCEKKIVSKETTFDTSTMSPGIYFLTLKNESELITKKIILSR